MSKLRVEAFSDGVFAIAITLLILTIAQPTSSNNAYNQLGNQLAERWPSLAAYAVSFAVIGIMWLNHHTIFNHLDHIDRGMFYRNLLLLMTVVFIPYPTGIFGEALRVHSGEKTAAVFYSAAMTVNAIAWTAMWLHASVGRRLLHPDFPEEQRKISTLLFSAGVLFYAIATGIAFLNPYACLAFHGALALYYAFDPISRRVERQQSP